MVVIPWLSFSDLKIKNFISQKMYYEMYNKNVQTSYCYQRLVKHNKIAIKLT